MRPEFSAEHDEAGRAWIPYFVLAVTLLLTCVAVYFVAREDAAANHTPYVLAGGLLVSLILFWLARSQARARAAAEGAAAQLGQSEVRFRTLIEQSPLSTQIFSPDGRTLQVNRAWEQLWGVTLETLGDYNVLKDEQLVEKGIMPYLERGFAGTPTQVPAILYDPEASIPHVTTHEHPQRWVQALIYPVRDAAGEIREVVLVHEDITERKRVEETLRYQLNLTSAITTHTAEGLCLLDAEGRLTMMNPAAEAMLGWTEAELKGRVLHDAVHYLKPDGSPFPRSECPLVGVINRRETVANREDVWVRRDGTLIPIFCSCVPIVVDGKVTGAVLAAHDIAERKRADDARARLEAQLHRRAEQLAEANRVKDEFLATLSHELRTPLTAILGWAKLMRSESFDPQMSGRALEIIERSAVAQSQLINDLLDVSRIITGKLRLAAQPVELAPVIAAAVDSLRPAADARGVRLEVRLDGAAVQVSGDADRLQQVFWNLVSNAIKFTPKAGRICVQLRRAGSQAEIVVEDTGQGIKQDFLPYIFDRFRQADGSITREHSGLGLGLSIVRHIVELHGGRVRAESEGEGRGTTFRITLPLSALKPQPHDDPHAEGALHHTDPGSATSHDTDPDGAPRDIDPAASRRRVPVTGDGHDAAHAGDGRAATGDGRVAASGGDERVAAGGGDERVAAGGDDRLLAGLRVLVVDDDPNTRALLVATLEQSGAQHVAAVASAVDALGALGRLAPDVLLSDIGMPNVDGYELIRRIRALPAEQGGRTPAAALTAYATPDDRQRALDAGYNLHISKPVEPGELAAAVAHLAGR